MWTISRAWKNINCRVKAKSVNVVLNKFYSAPIRLEIFNALLYGLCPKFLTRGDVDSTDLLCAKVEVKCWHCQRISLLWKYRHQFNEIECRRLIINHTWFVDEDENNVQWLWRRDEPVQEQEQRTVWCRLNTHCQSLRIEHRLPSHLKMWRGIATNRNIPY